MSPAEQTAAGLAAAIAALRFAELGAHLALRDASRVADSTDPASCARLDLAREQWERIRDARLAMEWEATQVPGSPGEPGTGATP